MLYDCSECGEAYASAEGTVSVCPNCDAPNTASFRKPLGAPKSRRMGAWAAGLGAAFFILGMAALSWSAMDVDSDGLSSYREMQEGSDPWNSDTDADGISDGWEVRNGLSPLRADSNRNGISDLAEFRSPVPSDDECSGLLLLERCESTEQPTNPSGAEPEPPSGDTGTGLSALVGGVSAVAAGVTARLVSTAILRK